MFVLMLFGMSAPSMQVFAQSPNRGLEISHTDLDLSKLDMYEFKCRQENMQVLHTDSGTLQQTVVPNGKWKKSTVFMHKFNKSATQQGFDNVLELLFSNAGEINGRKVNVRVKVNHLRLNPTQYCGQQENFNDPNSGVPFLTVDQNWGDSGIQLMDHIYPDHPNFNSNVEQAFGIRAEVTATLEYADGTPCDLKLTMQPTDIDVKPGNKLYNGNKTSFYEGVGVQNINTAIDKIVYNNDVKIQEHDYLNNWHWWEAHPSMPEVGTSGVDEYNKTGFAMRAKANSIRFAYYSAATSGSLFKFYAEVPYYNNPEKTAKKVVDKKEVPKKVGEPIKYTVTYTVPRPGVDIIDDIKSLKFTDQFDKKVDFKNAQVKLDGQVLNEGTDYKLSKIEAEGVPPTIEIDIINKALFGRDKAGKVYEITYNTVTNKKALVKGDDEVVNSTARMYFDNTPVFANTVKTKLIPPKGPEKTVFKGGTTTVIDGKVVQPESELTYAVTYKNTTGEDVKATITDKIPAHTKFVSAENGGKESGGVVTWKADVAKDQSVTVKFTVKVDKNVNGASIGNVAKVNDGTNDFTTNETHNPTPTGPEKTVFKGGTTTKIDGQVVQPESELTYAVTYKNTTGKNVKATITDKIPEHTTFVSAENGGAEKDGVVTWKADVAKDQSVTVKFTVKVDKNVNGASIGNVAKVNDGTNDFTTNETHNPTPTEPEKTVFKGGTTTQIDGKRVEPGEELTYAVTYKNTTGKDVKATITDKLPAHTSFVSADNGGKEAGGVVTWTADVAKDQSLTVKFTVKVDKNVNGAPVDNQAKVNDGTNDYNTNETHNPTPEEPKKEVFKGGTTTKIDGEVVQPGDELTYAITYKNTTGEDVKATITDKLPQYTSFVSADNGGKEAGGVVTWTADVAKGQSVTVKFTVKVNKKINGVPVDNRAKVNDGTNDYHTNETHNPTPKEPVKEVLKFQSNTKIDGKRVEPGQKITYAITYKNTTGKEADVTITDKIPAHTSFVSADNGGKEAGGVVTWSKKVADGDVFVATFTVQVDRDVNGNVIKNKATANDGKNSYDTNEVTNPTPTKPGKKVFKGNTAIDIDHKRVEPGQELTYAVTYKNTTDQAVKATITDKIPAHTTFVSAENGGKYADGKVTWTADVAKGAGITVKFRVKVDQNVNGAPVDNKARVNDGTNWYNTNETHNPTPKEPIKDVFKPQTTTSIDGKPVKGGQELTYAITYENTTGQAVKATITDKIPAYTSFVSAENGGKEAGGVVTWTADVAKGGRVTVKFTVKVDPNVNGAPVDNKARVNDGTNDYDTNETHNPTPTEPRKEVFKSGTTTNIDGQRVEPGQKLTYAITYANTTGAERDVTITDRIPAYTSFVSADNGGKFAGSVVSGGTVTWTKKVAAGEIFRVTFTVKVDNRPNGATLTNKANVRDGVNDSDTNTVKNLTPKTPEKPAPPKTGDHTGIGLFMLLLLASGGALGTTAVRRRKRQ